MKEKLTRRKFIQRGTATSMMAASPMVATVGAKSDDEVTAEEAGVEKALRHLLQNGKVEKAESILNRHNIAHSTESVKMPTIGSGEGGDDISTQAEYSKSNSSFYHSVYNDYDNVWHVHVNWDLADDDQCSIDGPGPKDGVGITYNPDILSPVVDSWEFGDYTSLDKRGDEGIIGKFDDVDCYQGESRVESWQSVDVRRTEDSLANIYNTYAHTWGVGGAGGSVSFELSIGPIKVNEGFDTDSWKKRSDTTI